ncbi:MAG: hypothetical protein HOO67_06385 [Candidatus Peribacteraceae bacterium]|nr:hypothetical protein [Candidatus Peribacteraceae bacterium]
MADKAGIEAAIALAEAETGVRGGKRSIPLCFSPAAKQKARVWTEKEEQFVRDNLGRISQAELARQLDRTPIAVKLHCQREMHLVSMSKAPEIITAEQVANGMGIDGKSVHRLMDTGLMPVRRLPSARPMRVIDRLSLMKWILNPDHWCYFKPERVGALERHCKRGIGAGYDFAFWEKARELVLKARRTWKDRWLTPGQVVRILKIYPKPNAGRRNNTERLRGVRYVNVAIRKGNLKATRWGNWWIKKSDLPKRGWTINYCGRIVKKRAA